MLLDHSTIGSSLSRVLSTILWHLVKYRSSSIRTALYSTTRTLYKKNDQLPPRPTLPDEVLTKKFLKGSGPGGQKINKTSSAVQLTHVPTGIVVKSQATRSRTQNEHIAKRILAEKIEFLEKGSESRVEKKRERASRKKRSAEKKSRRKYKKLAEEKGGLITRDGEEGKEEEDDEDDEYEDEGDETTNENISVRGERQSNSNADRLRDTVSAIPTISTNARMKPD